MEHGYTVLALATAITYGQGVKEFMIVDYRSRV